MKFYNFLVKHKKRLLVGLCVLFGTAIMTLITCFVFLFFLLHQFIPLVPYAPELLGFKGTKNYLILFQNNMELRPGGGFIGSFATITISNGKLGNLQVHNTYDADGQLHQHVEPYYIGRRFIQVHLFMRDSNFDVDFLKSAQKVAYLYQLETGYHADGVIAIDFTYVQNLVKLLSPIYVWQYNTTVTDKNVFYLTEYHADKHSFYGSTQKQDFLRGLYEGMQIKFLSHKFAYLLGIGEQTIHAIQQKHILFALMDQHLQKALTQANVSSTLYDPRSTQPGTVNDFFGVNEANIGINKSNYFLTRSIKQQAIIDANGTITEHITLTYHNASPKEEWPIGRYIPYIRLILPQHAKLTSISIDGKIQHMVPAVTDFHIYEAPGFVPPQGLEVDKNEEEGKTLYGFRTLISYHTSQVVGITYSLEQRIDMHNPQLTYSLFVFKQPGTTNDSYTFSLQYPPLYTSIATSANITKTQSAQITLHSSLLTDKHLTFTLRQ